MDLVDAYSIVKPSIVAFAPKYLPVIEGKKPPLFSQILGTGFVVDPEGIVATNDHVVRALLAVQKPKDIDDDWPVTAIMFRLTPKGMLEMHFDVKGAVVISKFAGGDAYYGPEKGPDLAFVHLAIRGLPALKVGKSEDVKEGIELATAGYPMGTDALTAPGKLHQLTPTLQRGIVSAVLPFPCLTPHAFCLNVMAQGGASGSPVFFPNSGEVAGVLYAGLNNPTLTYDLQGKKIGFCHQPTNISYIVPAHYLARSMTMIPQLPELAADTSLQTVDELMATGEMKHALKDRRWEIYTERAEDEDGA